MNILDIPRRIKLGKIYQQIGAVTNYQSWQLITRMYADSRVQKIYGGTNEIMKELISRSL